MDRSSSRALRPPGRSRRTWQLGGILAASLTFPEPAVGQRSEDNAVVGAADAFGQAVGNEKIGLYSADDVRGFSPVEAGNTRLEGLYFVPVDQPIALVADSNTIRVGIAAQSSLFPAPTGIVDYALKLPEEDGGTGLLFQRGQYGSTHIEGETHLRLGQRVGLLLSAARRDQNRHEGGSYSYTSASAALAWRPYAGALVASFLGGLAQRDDEAVPALFPAGDYLPPRIPRRQFIGQSWADRRFESRLSGLVVRFPLGRWGLEAGLFRAQRDYTMNFADLMLALRPDGTTPNRVIVADPNNRDAVTSGEARLSYGFAAGATTHKLTASLRGRQTARRFGGGQRIGLGESTAWSPDERPPPVLSAAPDDRDSVRQYIMGVSYLVSRPQRFSLNAAISRSRYRKAVDFASAARPDVQSAADPWLGSLRRPHPRLRGSGGGAGDRDQPRRCPAGAAHPPVGTGRPLCAAPRA